VSDTTAIAKRIDVGALIEQAVDKGSTVDTLERLLAMAKDVRAEQARAAWHRAMADFQNDVPEVLKTKTAKVRTKSGAEYTYHYAPLQDLISAVRPKLATHGLSVTFETQVTKDHVMARCIVGHEDGHVQNCEFVIPIDLQSHMNPAQQVASACTYARRYAYMSALGLSPEDDDDGASATPEKPVDETFRTSTQRKIDQEQNRQVEGDPVWRGKLGNVDTKAGTTNNRKWTIYTFTGSDGEKFGTFDEKIASGLIALDGHFIEIVYETTAKGNKNIVEYRDVTQEEAPFNE
jgi:hypothetical protein